MVPVVSFLLFNGLLWLCLVIAVTRYWVGVSGDRKVLRKTLAESNFLKSEIEGLNADMRRANERGAANSIELTKQFNRQMEEHAFFTPLQWEVFTLVRELRAFAQEVGPSPLPENDPAMRVRDGEDAEAFLRRAIRITGPYLDRVRFGYEHRFLERVKTARAKLAERSIKDEWLTNVVESVRKDDDVTQIAERLFALAMKIGARTN